HVKRDSAPSASAEQGAHMSRDRILWPLSTGLDAVRKHRCAIRAKSPPSRRLALHAPAPDDGRDQGQGGGSDALDALRLSNGLGPCRNKLLLHLVGEAGQKGIVEPIGNCSRLVAANCFHIGLLPLQIDGVLCVDSQLLVSI